MGNPFVRFFPCRY
jgi:hypothetical protein